MLSLMEINESNKEKLINELKERVEDADSSVIESVRNILSKVKSDGDEALFELTKTFDKVELNNLQISSDEIERCFDKVEDEFIEALKEAKINIENYHMKQKKTGYIMTEENGIYLGQRVLPLFLLIH